MATKNSSAQWNSIEKKLSAIAMLQSALKYNGALTCLFIFILVNTIHFDSECLRVSCVYQSCTHILSMSFWEI